MGDMLIPSVTGSGDCQVPIFRHDGDSWLVGTFLLKNYYMIFKEGQIGFEHLHKIVPSWWDSLPEMPEVPGWVRIPTYKEVSDHGAPLMFTILGIFLAVLMCKGC